MSDSARLSNTTAAHRISAKLKFGLFQITNYRKDYNPSADFKTYYVLRDNRLVTFREWHQLNRPDFHVSGTKAGCLAFLRR